MKMRRRDTVQEDAVNILVAHRHGIALEPKEAMGNTTAMCQGSLRVTCFLSMPGHGSDRQPYTMPLDITHPT
jgi:hypothetical protein